MSDRLDDEIRARWQAEGWDLLEDDDIDHLLERVDTLKKQLRETEARLAHASLALTSRAALPTPAREDA